MRRRTPAASATDQFGQYNLKLYFCVRAPDKKRGAVNASRGTKAGAGN
ncbi:MAG: hypothetical protein MPL62_02260 [Alphaproteobacteria bacterium]|nr:hypothetical protein [Alphaproteobacteria bacterium]